MPGGLEGVRLGEVRFNGVLLRAQMDVVRILRGLRWRDIARELDVSASAFTRLKTNQPPGADILLRMLLWLGETDVEQYVMKEEK